MEHRWGRFVNLQPLGQGGSGVVFRAYDPVAKRDVALKALRAGGLATPGQIERLRREALALARLQHRYLLAVYGLERGDDGSLVLVGPLVQGEDLEGRLERSGPLAADDAATLVRKVAEGVAHAHRAKILHRDIKPANVLLSSETSEPLLADFGIARISGEGQSLTVTGQWLGTPAYMAPEQGLGKAVGEGVDVYGLGALLFACLTATPPRDPPSLMALMDEFTQGKAPPVASAVEGSTADRSLDAICRRAMAHDPAERYASVRDLVAVLRGYEAGERSSRLGRVVLGVAGAALVGLVAVGVALSVPAGDEPPAEPASTSPPQEGPPASAPRDPSVEATRDTWLQRIVRREERDDHSGVLAAAQELLRRDPGDLEAGFWEARSLTELERYEEALSVLERFLEGAPESGLLVYQRGDVHERTIPSVGREVGEPRALADYGRAIELGVPQRWEREARLSRAGLLRDARQWERAKVDYQWLADDDPSAPAHLVNLGYLSQNLGKPPEALAFFNAALAVDPDHAGALLNRATAYQGAGRQDAALADLRRVLQRESELDPDQAAQARFQLAGVHMMRGELDMAIESARDSVRHARAHTTITDRSRHWIVLAQLLQRAGRAREGLDVLDEYLSISPGHLPVLRLAYDQSLALADLPRSLAIYEQAREHHPDAYAVDLMAAELLAERQPATALAHCERALRVTLPLADALRLRVLCAKLYLRASRPQDALVAVDPLFAYLDAVDPAARLEVLWLRICGLARSGKRAEAKAPAARFLREAPPSDPRCAEVRDLLKT